jgi:hypothetical protein
LGYDTYTHGNVTRELLYRYLKQQTMSFFFFYKIGEQEAEQVLPGGRCVGTSESGEEMGKRHGRIDMVHTHVCK